MIPNENIYIDLIKSKNKHINNIKEDILNERKNTDCFLRQKYLNFLFCTQVNKLNIVKIIKISS